MQAPTTSGAAVTYYCINQCPYYNGTMWVSGQPTFDQSGGSDGHGGTFNYITYSFNPVDYTLTGTSGFASGQTITVNPAQTGQQLMSGPLLTLAQYNGVTNNGTSVPDMAMLFDGSVTSYVTWQSGSNSFNNYTSIADANGVPLPLSAPLQLVYTDPTTGGNIFLQYAGIGNLQGIPGTCVDSSGTPVSMNACSQPGNTWKPSYNIASGQQLTHL